MTGRGHQWTGLVVVPARRVVSSSPPCDVILEGYAGRTRRHIRNVAERASSGALSDGGTGVAGGTHSCCRRSVDSLEVSRPRYRFYRRFVLASGVDYRGGLPSPITSLTPPGRSYFNLTLTSQTFAIKCVVLGGWLARAHAGLRMVHGASTEQSRAALRHLEWATDRGTARRGHLFYPVFLYATVPAIHATFSGAVVCSLRNAASNAPRLLISCNQQD